MEKYLFVLFYQILMTAFLSCVLPNFLTPQKHIHHPQITVFIFHITVHSSLFALVGFSLDYLSILIVINLLLSCVILFQDKLSKKLIAFFVAYFSLLGCEASSTSIMLLMNILIPKLHLTPYYIIANGGSNSYIAFSIIVAAQLYLYYKLVIPALKECVALLNVRIALQLAFPIFITFLLTNVITIYSRDSQEYIFITLIFLLFCMSSFVIYIRGLHNLQELNMKQLQQELEEEQLKSQLMHYQKLEKKYEDIRRWNHDISNHLLSISYLVEKEDYTSAGDYIQNILEPTKENPS